MQIRQSKLQMRCAFCTNIVLAPAAFHAMLMHIGRVIGPSCEREFAMPAMLQPESVYRKTEFLNVYACAKKCSMRFNAPPDMAECNATRGQPKRGKYLYENCIEHSFYVCLVLKTCSKDCSEWRNETAAGGPVMMSACAGCVTC